MEKYSNLLILLEWRNSDNKITTYRFKRDDDDNDYYYYDDNNNNNNNNT